MSKTVPTPAPKIDETAAAAGEPQGKVPPVKGGRTEIREKKKPHRKLQGLSDVRRFFIRNQEPVFFISATNFNLMSMDEWVHRFRFINYLDCFDGHHPNVFVPSERPHPPFDSLEEIVNYLLEHPEVREYIQSRGPGGKAVFLFFDERTEELCRELGLEVCFPPAELREKIDHKINTTRIANRARVRSVPNVLAKNVDSYDKLRQVARKLGDDLVIQTPYGDSGHTTFFIASEEDWKRHQDEIVGQKEIKVMKRIDPEQAAVEACVTRAGTIVGPLMTELVGFPELTPYRGGWAGNEVFADAFSKKVREKARKRTVALGEELRKMGYKGYFEVDYLVDRGTDNVYLGEINPRVTGASSMTNLASFAHADAPLFLFHLLEWFDVEYELDVEALNARWSDPENIDAWSQMVIKHTDDTVDLVTAAPETGVWRLGDDGTAHYLHRQTHRRTVERENEGFFLRIAKAGDYRYEGADLGILLTPGRLMDDDGELTDRARAWIRGIRARFAGEVTTAPPEVAEAAEIGNFKML